MISAADLDCWSSCTGIRKVMLKLNLNIKSCVYTCALFTLGVMVYCSKSVVTPNKVDFSRQRYLLNCDLLPFELSVFLDAEVWDIYKFSRNSILLMECFIQCFFFLENNAI